MDQREASRKNWGLFKTDSPTIDELNSGALQRIADATELMATNHIQMSKDLAWYKSQYELRGKILDQFEKKISSYKGVITRMKNKKNKL